MAVTAAAEKSTRVCRCGCGSSIEGMAPCFKYTRECSERVERARRVMQQRSRTPDQRRAETERSKRRKSAASPWSRVVANRHEHTPNRSQVLCRVCCGMPWARRHDRSDDKNGVDMPVTGDNGLCRGCGEAWAPEPPINIGSALCSSAGLCVNEGKLYGASFQKRGRPEKRGDK